MEGTMSAQITRKARRPCRYCGGVYFARGIAPLALLFSFAGLVAGGYGLFTVLMSQQPGHPHGKPVFLAGFAVMILASVIGSRRRCIKCDRVQ
jgi:hypothetical protein